MDRYGSQTLMLKDRLRKFSPAPPGATLIAADTELRGDISFSGTVQIEGRVIGNIEAADGQVCVARDGYVEGIIRAPRVLVDGIMVGDIHAADHLQLDAGARVDGDLHYRFMEMVSGAQINGQLYYLGERADEENDGLISGHEFKSS